MFDHKNLSNLEEHDQVFSTVVGSYPTVNQLTGKANQFFEYEKSSLNLSSLFDHLVANAVIEQLFITTDVTEIGKSVDEAGFETSSEIKQLGLDVIGTGQPSIKYFGNMNSPIYDCIDGLNPDGQEQKHYHLTDLRKLGLNESWGNSHIVRELEVANSVIDRFYKNEIYSSTRLRKPRLKISFSGPATLSQGIHRGNRSPVKTARKMAEVLLDLVTNLKNQDLLKYVHHIQLDEPILSQVDFVDFVQFASKATKSLIEKIHELGVFVSLHMCGPFEEGHLSLFEGAPLYALDLEVAYFLKEAGVEIHRNKSPFLELEKSVDKLPDIRKWGLGLVNSTNHRVETAIEIDSLVNRLANVVDRSKLLFSPDCGLRGLTAEQARQKLHSMLNAVAIHRRNLCWAHEIRSRELQEDVSETALDSEAARKYYGRFCYPPTETTSTKIVRLINERLTFLHSRGFEFFSVHDHKHSRRVIYYVNQILGPLPFRQTDRIIRLLFIAAYGHDIGLFHPGEGQMILGSEPDADLRLQEVEIDCGTTRSFVGTQNQQAFLKDPASTRKITSIFDENKLGKFLRETENGYLLADGQGNEKMAKHIRSIHGFRSGRFFNSEIGWLKDDQDEFLVDATELKAIIEIVVSHQSSSSLPPQLLNYRQRGTKPEWKAEVDLSKIDYDLAFLASVLRVADECDMAYHRLPPKPLRRRVERIVEDAKNSGLPREEWNQQQLDAERSIQEYDKMELIKAVHVDHFNGVIWIFYDRDDATSGAVLRKINDVREHIQQNLDECSDILANWGIRLRTVLIKPKPCQDDWLDIEFEIMAMLEAKYSQQAIFRILTSRDFRPDLIRYAIHECSIQHNNNNNDS